MRSWYRRDGERARPRTSHRPDSRKEAGTWTNGTSALTATKRPPGRLRRQRGDLDLPDHPRSPWPSTATTGPRPAGRTLGRGPGRRRDAVRGGRRGRAPRGAAEGRAGDDLHGVAGPPADDPDMFKIAGELTPAVIHVAARTLATHALSIFGDHSDVMHARTTGWAMLAAGSVQEATTSRSSPTRRPSGRGSRSSTSSTASARPTRSTGSPPRRRRLRALVRDDDLLAFRAARPDARRSGVRGTAQNPDVFFQAREASNPFHLAVPGIVQEVMDELAARTGRRHGLSTTTAPPTPTAWWSPWARPAERWRRPSNADEVHKKKKKKHCHCFIFRCSACTPGLNKRRAAAFSYFALWSGHEWIWLNIDRTRLGPKGRELGGGADHFTEAHDSAKRSGSFS